MIKELRTFTRQEIEEKLKELGEKIEGKYIKSDEWKAEILKESEVYIGKLRLSAVTIKIEISEKKEKEFLENFRIKFSRGGG